VELAVEKVAVPVVKIAAGFTSSRVSVAALAFASKNRAAPARICKLPVESVLTSSPPNTVLPTDIGPVPTRA
jgi:hypothetical protein